MSLDDDELEAFDDLDIEECDEEYYDDLDDEDDPLADCHYDPRSKVCGKAGSEECDFECPLGRAL